MEYWLHAAQHKQSHDTVALDGVILAGLHARGAQRVEKKHQSVILLLLMLHVK